MFCSVKSIKINELLKRLDVFAKKVDDELGLPDDEGNKALLREIVFSWLDETESVFRSK
jgi:hypothetical protein